MIVAILAGFKKLQKRAIALGDTPAAQAFEKEFHVMAEIVFAIAGEVWQLPEREGADEEQIPLLVRYNHPAKPHQ